MNLTHEQQKVVDDDSPIVGCVSAAGSGKTRILMARVLKLLKDGASADSIMLLTFTRKAAAEMRERLANNRDQVSKDSESGWLLSLAPDVVRALTIGTFHSVAMTIIKSELRDKYDVDRLTIMDPDQFQECVRDTCIELGYLNDQGKWTAGVTKGKVDDWFGELFSTGKFPKDPVFIPSQGVQKNDARTSKRSARPLEMDAQRIIQAVLDRLVKLNVVSYGTMLIEADYAMSMPTIVKRWHEKIKHVLVDEAQDCDELQWSFVRKFAPPATLFFVGDPRQSIYGWRGARPEIMDKFAIEPHHVHTNFRSTREVVDVANRLQPDYLPMNCATPALPGRIEKCDRVSHTIIELRGEGYNWSDIAILTRANWAADRAVGGLISENIPCHRVGGSFTVTKTPEFLRVLGMLNLTVNTGNDFAFIQAKDLLTCTSAFHEIRQHALETSSRLYTSWLQLRSTLGEYTASADMAAWIEKVHSGNPTVSGALATLDQIHPICDERIVRFWENFAPTMTVPAALAWYGLRDSQDDLTRGDEVTVSTIHSTKGLEWPVVILAAMDKPKRGRERMDPEEWRVMYVAVTRAKERLYINYDEEPNSFAKKILEGA